MEAGLPGQHKPAQIVPSLRVMAGNDAFAL